MRSLILSRLALQRFWRALFPFAAIGLICCFSGCRTGPSLPPVNLSKPGWQLRQGQALWRSKKKAPEIAGEVILATNTTGRAFIQFLKNPLPLLTAQISPQGWQIEFIPEKRHFGGRGIPPKPLLWLHLLDALQSAPLPRGIEFAKAPDGAVRIENKETGENITLFLNESQ
ncbi:MAG TPA: hypothetical protein VKM56_04275 [Verrucomicrobiae bacterium]|nr:hypothetical protein [Verrucomicrobiae bacterium]